MNKITTIIGLSFVNILSSWISDYTYKIYDDWFFRCIASLHSDGCSNHYDGLRSFFR